MKEPGRSAIGTWSGGRFLHFGAPLEEDRLAALLRPGEGIDTVLTADAYGTGGADEVLGKALAGVDREGYSLVGAVGHVFSTLLLPAYIGSIPFPISALISGLVNAALVWAAGRWTTSARLAALPLWTWLLTVLAMAAGGPGGDVIFGGRGVMAYSPLLLLVMGVVPPLVVLYRCWPTR